MPYAFVDTGDVWMGDEELLVGPFPTEEDARAHAEGRTVLLLLSYEDWKNGDGFAEQGVTTAFTTRVDEERRQNLEQGRQG